MKLLTNTEVIYILQRCNSEEAAPKECENNCPLFKECLYYWTGEECGSAFETDKE